MLDDLIASLSRPREYRRFAVETPARAASYVAFLSLLFLGAFAVSVKLRLAPLFAETFSWMETRMPVLRFSGGRISSGVRGPLRLEHPRYKDVAIVIDTDRTTAVAPKELEDAKAGAYLTADALYLPSLKPGQLEKLDLSRSAGRPVVLDAASYRAMKKSFDWVFYPAILLLVFLLFALSLAALGLIYALLGMLMASLAGASLGFGALLRLAVHAQSAAALLRALDQLSPVAVPYARLISPLLTLVTLWLGVRAAARLEPPPSAPAA
ncbi:MAG: DUF1189 family protein [Elusimicrobia bacterium]|nr:DUF1189 family protein [Elusimicrobiota bacterium]